MTIQPLDLFYKRLGENIRKLRSEQKIKQETIASYLGLSRISISNIESGKQKIQLHSLIALARLLHVGIDEIVPKTENIDFQIETKLEKKISNTEIIGNQKSIDKAKDFINFSKKTIST